MTTSRSFDRAADYYDQTRDLPEPVATYGIPALLNFIAPIGKIFWMWALAPGASACHSCAWAQT